MIWLILTYFTIGLLVTLIVTYSESFSSGDSSLIGSDPVLIFMVAVLWPIAIPIICIGLASRLYGWISTLGVEHHQRRNSK